MSQLEKAIRRLKSCPKDYTYDEARYIMGKLAFKEDNKGATSGSRVQFYRESDMKAVSIHKPHPGNIMKSYAVRNLMEFLEGLGEI